VRILEGEDYEKHVGPALFVVSQESVGDFDTSSTLAPDGFRPVFRVE
jgi:protein TorT